MILSIVSIGEGIVQSREDRIFAAASQRLAAHPASGKRRPSCTRSHGTLRLQNRVVLRATL